MKQTKALTDSRIIFAIVDKRDEHYGQGGEVLNASTTGKKAHEIAVKDILWNTIAIKRYTPDQFLTLAEFRKKDKEMQSCLAKTK